MKKFLIVILVIGFVYLSLWLVGTVYTARNNIAWEAEPIPPQQAAPVEEEEPEPEVPKPALEPIEIQTTLHKNVPFSSQAPLGQWTGVYEDACEETSILMAAYYIQGKTLSRDIANREILALADYGEETLGHFIDTSAADTAKMLHDNYDIVAEVVYDMTLEDLQKAVVAGHIVIVPAAGRELGNPNFTPPGPLNHMLVITGYDAETQEFVTNDPGTRDGKDYRYDEDVLYAAIRDYPTGRHLPNPARRKAMILVKIPSNL